MAHRGHTWRGDAAVEGPTKRRLEGQNLVPLAPQPPAAGGLHQVRPEPGPELGACLDPELDLVNRTGLESQHFRRAVLCSSDTEVFGVLHGTV